MKHFTPSDWANREDRYWSTLFNTVSGPRSAIMIGTQNNAGIANLGLFNSVVHLGANPPLLGFILRPTTVKRHTYDNLKNNGCYTLNHSTVALLKQAHQTSAKYDDNVDEFEETGLKKLYVEGFAAPFVDESPIQIGLTFVEEHLIHANQTRLIVGEIKHLRIAEALICPDGRIDTSAADTLLVSGLDAYHSHHFIEKAPYARP